MTDLRLVADIGGTNTRVALADGVVLRKDSIRRYRNADQRDLETVLAAYLAEEGNPTVGGASIAVAGPVRGGVAKMTNLDWTIDADALRRATGAQSVAVLNDLQAQGHALGYLPEENLRAVTSGVQAEAGGAMLVVGVGTGFNAAPVHVEHGLRVVAASESGHVNLPVRTADDLKLADFLAQEHGFPGVEDALSGRGIEHLHTFLTGTKKPSSEIIPAIGSDDGATRTAELFVRLLGAVVGNLALTHLPYGGIYLCGGMSRAFTPHLERFGFLEAMCDKGRFSDLTASFPVWIIEDDYAALTGCAATVR